jgi:hypothetical protein
MGLIRISLVVGLAVVAQLGGQFFSQSAWGAISYTTSGATITENFDGLPTDAPNNGNLESVYTDGWRDDTNTTATSIGIQGWYLFHPISPANENGFNGNQRFRMGVGQNTGAFWGFASGGASDAEKALGSIGATTVAGNGANMYIGMQLTNNTGQTLTSFTVTYDGEQYRDGQSTSAETMFFDYNIGATGPRLRLRPCRP